MNDGRVADRSVNSGKQQKWQAESLGVTKEKIFARSTKLVAAREARGSANTREAAVRPSSSAPDASASSSAPTLQRSDPDSLLSTLAPSPSPALSVHSGGVCAVSRYITQF